MFLGATKHLYNWLCPSVGRCVSVGRVTHSFDDPPVAPYWPTWPWLMLQTPATCLFFLFNNCLFVLIFYFILAIIVYRVLFFVPKKTVKMIHTLLQCVTIIVIIFGLKVGCLLNRLRFEACPCASVPDTLCFAVGHAVFFLCWRTRLAISIIDLTHLVIHSFD